MTLNRPSTCRPTCWLVLLVVVGLGPPLWPAASSAVDNPRLVPFQGRLVDEHGAARNGVFRITFRIYDVPTGGLELWSETHSTVSIMNGQLNVLLGSLTSLDDPGAGKPPVTFDQPKFLGITIGADTSQEMVPRQQLVPSFHARTADEASMADDIRDNTISAAKLKDGAVTTSKLSDNAVTTAKLGDSAVTAAQLADAAVTASKLAAGAAEAVIPNIAEGAAQPIIVLQAQATLCPTTGGACRSIASATGGVVSVTNGFNSSGVIKNVQLTLQAGVIGQAYCLGVGVVQPNPSLSCIGSGFGTINLSCTGFDWPTAINFICIGQRP